MKPKSESISWDASLRPLFKKYRNRKHPLQFDNAFQLIVMIVLSARASDSMVNALAPKLFKKYPTLKQLADANPVDLYPYLRVPGFRKKAEWIVTIAQSLKGRKTLPTTMSDLLQLKGFGRKSANVYMSQMELKPEDVFVDLHTLRVAPRLGIAGGTDPLKIEKQLMESIREIDWHVLGLSLTYLGRELCRPKEPKCSLCVVNSVCNFSKWKK